MARIILSAMYFIFPILHKSKLIIWLVLVITLSHCHTAHLSIYVYSCLDYQCFIVYMQVWTCVYYEHTTVKGFYTLWYRTTTNDYRQANLHQNALTILRTYLYHTSVYYPYSSLQSVFTVTN